MTGFPPPVDVPPAAGAYPPPIDYPPITAYPPPGGDFAPPGSYPQTVAGPPPLYGGQQPPYGGYPPPYGAYSLQQQGTNGLAIASLICSLSGPFLCGIPSMVGLVLGIIAMNQIKKTGDGGRGVALAGVIVGALITAFVAIFFILYLVGSFYAVSSSSRY